MTKTNKHNILENIITHLEKTNAMIKIAKKGHNSLNGTNSYAKKFLEQNVESTNILKKYELQLDTSDNSIKQSFDDLTEHVSRFYDSKISDGDRKKLLRESIVIYKTKISPNLTTKTIKIPSNKLFPFELVEKTRDYIEKVALQASRCYENSWYDASAVMIRRLLETLIIECFEKHTISHTIKNTDGDFLYLKDLIIKFLNEDGQSWNVGRNVKKALPKLKAVGDQSAHSRRFNAIKHDIDDIKNELRLSIQELVSIADLKRN